MTAQLPGNVPLFEEHAARVEAGYTLPEWASLDPRGRAFEVAHYRLRQLIQIHQLSENMPKGRKR